MKLTRMVVLMTGLGILVLSGLAAQDSHRITRNEEVIRAHIDSTGHAGAMERVRENEKGIHELHLDMARVEGKLDTVSKLLWGCALALLGMVLDRLVRVYQNARDAD